MIVVDHVSGDPLAMFTYRILGFSDAAEIFVFLSGIACGIAYSRIFARDGMLGLIRSTATRAGRIYLYYALSSAAMILIISTAMPREGLNSRFHVGLYHYFVVAVEDPFSALGAALCLISAPPLADILVLYMMLTLVAVPAFLGAGDRYRFLVLVISGLIWAISQIFSDVILPLTNRWNFNPLAWQFLFVIGLFAGSQYDTKQSILPTLSRRRSIVIAAWIIVISAFLYKLMTARSGFDIAWLRFDQSAWASMKQNLSPLRLVHFLSVALLVAIYFRQDNALMKWRISLPVIKTGMHSLEVFSLAVVIDVLENLILIPVGPSISDRIAIDAVAFLLMTLTAIALAHRRNMLVKTGAMT
jgi:hypothetical protein